MPDLFLIASAKDAKVLKKHIEIIGLALRQATANTFPDLAGNAKKVAVYILPHAGGDNIPPLQILGLANWSQERESLLEEWQKALSLAWWEVLYSAEMVQYQNTFPVSETEIWPIMPKGIWGLARPPAIDHGG